MNFERKNAESFSTYDAFQDYLEFVEENQEWCYHTLDNTKFEVDDDNNLIMKIDNSFMPFNGDENEVEVYPVTDLAIPSLIRRAEVTGDGIERLYEQNKITFCTHLEDYFSTKGSSRNKLKSCILFGNCNAVHSGNYAPISQAEFYKGTFDFLFNSFSNVNFISGTYSEEMTDVLLSIEDSSLIGAYSSILNKYGLGKATSCFVNIIASDIAEASCICEPKIVSDNYKIPLGNKLSLRHTGKATVEKALEKISELFAGFTAQVRSLEILEDISITNAKNAMIKAFVYLKFPQKEASDIVEAFVAKYNNALEIYLHMTKVLNNINKSNPYDALRTEEQLARLIALSAKKWRSFDVSGTVSWNAKDN